MFEDTRSILEPAGALGVAGIKQFVADRGSSDATLVAIATGANMNFDRLRHVSERAELGEQREALLAATIDETKGSFRRFCSLLGRRSITEFNYRYADTKSAHVFVGVAVQGPQEAPGLVAELRQAGIEAVDLSGDELSKLHVRYMVGGRGGNVENEVLYRFEFPERPGALADFLDAMGQDWSISLFHYRNHGTDYGRVLAGIQVPLGDRPEFVRSLDKLGYAYYEETDNVAYRMFAR